MRRLGRRLLRASRTLPGARGWLETGLLAALFGALALILGFAGGLLEPEHLKVPAAPLLARTLFVPSVLEEVLFRVLPLPHPSETTSRQARLLWAGLSLALFVLWHPLSAALLSPAARATFFDPTFLLLAALLGATCTAAYLRTGSLWPPVLIHWLTVDLWVLLLGGGARLST